MIKILVSDKFIQISPFLGWLGLAIFFYWRDITPWAQEFLIARTKDSQWAPVFADQSIIIFLKRNEANRGVIAKYEIPQSYFKVTE